MRATKVLATIGCVILPFGAVAPVLAAPLPPVLVVNHETRECGQTFAGDECMDCFPPEGWEVLGAAADVECPAGYSEVESVAYTCQPFKNSFCCSEGHSGAPGDCEDLVVNHRTDQCAFVDDIENCELSVRWEQRPADVAPREWVCPAGYEWLDTLPCASAAGAGETSPLGSLPCLGAVALGPVTAALWFFARRAR